MPVPNRRPAVIAPPATRQPWTRGRCLVARKWTEAHARLEAATVRSLNHGSPLRNTVAFRCPHGDHWHVTLPPAACVACDGAGQNSRGTNECAGCAGTGVRRADS